jgi:hypothetical protein
MKNIKKIASQILKAHKDTVIIPIDVDYPMAMGIKSKVPRIAVDLDQISFALEKKFKTKERRTEITPATGNVIYFDLEE